MLKLQDDYTTLTSTFKDFILLVYTIIDDLYQQFVSASVSQRKNVDTAKMSAPEIITLSICGDLVGMDSENAWYSFVKRNHRHLFPRLCCRTRFNRTRRALLPVTELLRQKLIYSFPIPTSRYFVLDSFPLPVCKFGRARYCRSFREDGANYGRCPSKKETYFGFKVHAMITLEGYITAFEVTPASVASTKIVPSHSMSAPTRPNPRTQPTAPPTATFPAPITVRYTRKSWTRFSPPPHFQWGNTGKGCASPLSRFLPGSAS